MITPLPIPPSRQDPANFSQRADDFMGALPTFATEANSTATSVNNDASAASESAVNAAVSATAANASANVSKWVSGTTYAQGDVEWSPINFFSYRRKIAGAGTTDPSADPTNWELVSGAGDVSLVGVQTLTNKTLTSPVINTPVINTPVINTPVINTPVINSINGGQLAGMRNRIINGKMDIAQRGVNFPAASLIYTLDRWFVLNVSNAVMTLSQQSDSPTTGLQSSLRSAITTADTSIAAAEFSALQQVIEGFNARDLIGKPFTLSFSVRSSKVGTHCISFRNSGDDQAYVAEYVINTANAWEQKTITVSGGLITAGTWNWTNGIGLTVSWVLANGTTRQGSAGTWLSSNALSTPNQVNCLDTIGNIFAITGVQLEVGSVATPFEHRPYGMELAMCQRYYETGSCGSLVSVYAADSWILPFVAFASHKRSLPTVTVTRTAGALLTLAGQGYINGFRAVATATGVMGTSGFVDANYTAAAEL